MENPTPQGRRRLSTSMLMSLLMAGAASAYAAQDYLVAPSGGDITGAALSAKLAQGSVVLSSSGGGAAGSGNVVIKDVVAWSANTTLTLAASNDVIINGNVSASGNAAGLVVSPATANGSEPATATGTHRIVGAAVSLTGSGPTLTIAGVSYVVINRLGTAADATTAPTTPSLQGMAASANLTGNFALGSDIDASASAAWNAGAGFTPIGGGDPSQQAASAPFAGKFDGLGHGINDLSIKLPNQKWVGLFGATGKGSVVRNVNLRNAGVSGHLRVGALVGESQGTVSQASATGSVSGTVAASNNVGGLVGYNGAVGTVEKSYASVSVVGSGINMGGLVGANSGLVSNGYATGSVSGAGTGANVGGLVGNNFVYDGGSPRIQNSYATGAVTGKAPVGGLLGLEGGATTNSYWNTQTSGQSSSASGTGLTTAQMQTQSSFTGFDFSGTWAMVSGLTTPLLSTQNTTTIYNLLQLQLMAANPSANYTLGADIDASATGAGTDIWGSQGFIPVGSVAAPFTGSLNGNGFVIRNLTVNAPGTDHVGLFAYLGTAAVVQSVGLSSVQVTGRNSTGALAGHNDGTIAGSYADQVNVTGMGSGSSGSGGLVGTNSGTINGGHASGTVTGIDDVGGLVGVNDGTVSASYSSTRVTNALNQAGGLVGTNGSGGTISASHAIGVVGDVGTTGEMGGLVGLNNGTIKYSNALGRVDCGSGSSCGGLVGDNAGSIDNSYATGGIHGTALNAGGLVGLNGQGGSISVAYATGGVAGQADTGNVGGLVGNNGGTITNGYWNSSLSAQGIGTGGADGAKGLDANQRLVSANYAGFQFTATPGAQGWVVLNLDGSLQTAPSAGVAAVSPMLATEYSTVVDDAHQLQLMGMVLGASYRLAADVDALGTGNGAEVWSPKGFVPLGNGNNAFTGVLDGQLHRIVKLRIDRNDDNVGLLGVARNATIQNLGLSNAQVAGNNNVGGLVGVLYGGRIGHSYVDAYVYGQHTFASGKGDSIGTLVGDMDSGTIEASASSGIAYGGNFVGGLVGYNNGTISNSHSSANANARAGRSQDGTRYGDSGGLVGRNDSGTVTNSYARGNVIVRDPTVLYAGGLIADNAGTVSGGYWDVTTSWQSESDGGTGLSDAQMRQQASFPRWDFTAIWTMQTYPALRNMPAGYAP